MHVFGLHIFDNCFCTQLVFGPGTSVPEIPGDNDWNTALSEAMASSHHHDPHVTGRLADAVEQVCMYVCMYDIQQECMYVCMYVPT